MRDAEYNMKAMYKRGLLIQTHAPDKIIDDHYPAQYMGRPRGLVRALRNKYHYMNVDKEWSKI